MPISTDDPFKTVPSSKIQQLLNAAQKSYLEEKQKAPFFPYWGQHELTQELQRFEHLFLQRLSVAKQTIATLLEDEEMWKLVHRLPTNIMGSDEKAVIKAPKRCFTLFNTGLPNSFHIVVDDEKKSYLCLEQYGNISGVYLIPQSTNNNIDSKRLNLGLAIFDTPEKLQRYIIRRIVWSERYKTDLGH